MKVYWAFTLVLMMAAVGLSLDPRDVITRWVHRPKGYWLKVAAATFVLPPLFAILLAAIFPLTPEILGGLVLMSISPGAPMLTRMVAKKGMVFDPSLAASYQILVGLLTPLLTPALLHGVGLHFHRDVWVDPWVLAWQVASLQFVPLTIGLLLKHYSPGFADWAQPWMNRAGNLMVTGYLLVVVFGLRRVLLAVGPATAGIAVLLALACLAFGHWLGGATIALSNTNRHVGLAMLISGLNFPQKSQLIIPFFAAYAFTAPLLIAGYALWRRKSEAKIRR
jgi:BASS family bile acid:Na+ symporter